MFTGLVEAVGTIRQAEGSSPRRLTIASSIPTVEVRLGDSVSIDGCCLTVVVKGSETLTFEAATETLARTTIGSLRAGHRVHLERALAVGGRLDGHMVQGHVDTLGRVVVREMRGSALYLGVEVTADVAKLTAPRGSIALSGVSLTVTDVAQQTVFVALIPHTLAVTRLGEFKRGDPINVEADVLARYVARILEGPSQEHASGYGEGSLTLQYLKDKGFA